MIRIMLRPPRSERRTLRVVLGLALALGLLLMCHAAWSSTSDDVPATGFGVAAIEGASLADGSSEAPTTVVTDPGNNGIAGCCAILIACIIAVVCLGALLILRACHRGRILWRVPAGLRRIDGVGVLRAVELFSRKRPAVLIC